MSNTKAASPSHAERVLEYIEVTGAIFEKVAAMLADKTAQQTRIAALIPGAVKELLANERIQPHEKDAATRVLLDPVKALEVLTKTAAHRNDTERAQIGKPDGQVKKASYDSRSDAYVGRRSRPEEAESSKALKRKLGL
jgi:hypothetical protein